MAAAVQLVEAAGDGALLCPGGGPLAPVPSAGVAIPGRVAPGGRVLLRLRACAPYAGSAGTARLVPTAVAGTRERSGPPVPLRWTVDRRPATAISPASALGSISAGTTTFTFSDASTDERGPIAARTRTIDGEPAGRPAPTVSLAEPGLHTVSLAVRDPAGQEGDQAVAEVLVTEGM